MATTNAVTISVFLSLLFLLTHALQDPSTAVTLADSKPESESTAVGIPKEEGPYTTVVFRPNDVDVSDAIDPDLIAHSFRLPSHHHHHHHHHHHFHKDGVIRMPSGQIHPGFTGGERLGHEIDIEPEEEKERKEEHDDDEFEHKRKKMMWKKRENKKMDDDEEFGEKKRMKKRMRKEREHKNQFEDFEMRNKKHHHDHDHEDEEEERKEFGHKRMKRMRREEEGGRGFMDRIRPFFGHFF